MEQFVSIYTDDVFVVRDGLGWPTKIGPGLAFLSPQKHAEVAAEPLGDTLLTSAQAAARLGITVEQLVAHVEDGSLRYINVGRGKKKPRRRFDSADLDEFKATRSTLEQPCPSSSPKNPRRTTGSVSKSNVVGFTALRAARMKKTPSGSKR